MGAFLRENGIWIAAPIALIVCLRFAVIVLGGGGLGEFVYVIH
jgi:hypothetical protein